MAFSLYPLPGGGVGIENSGFRFTICIPSRRRSRLIFKNPLLPVANVLVDESEVEEYQRAIADDKLQVGALLGIPSHVRGLCNTRNHILDRLFLPDHSWQFQTDDDTIYFLWRGTRLTFQVTDPAYIIDVITASGLMAMEMPTGLFGYAPNAKPQERDSWQPFYLRAPCNAQGMGIVDRALRFDPQIPLHDDTDLSLQCLAKYGCTLVDRRWFVMYQGGSHAALPGGLAHSRSSLREQEAVAYLKKKWGDEVIGVGRNTASGITLSIKTTFK